MSQKSLHTLLHNRHFTFLLFFYSFYSSQFCLAVLYYLFICAVLSPLVYLLSVSSFIRCIQVQLTLPLLFLSCSLLSCILYVVLLSPIQHTSQIRSAAHLQFIVTKELVQLMFYGISKVFLLSGSRYWSRKLIVIFVTVSSLRKNNHTMFQYKFLRFEVYKVSICCLILYNKQFVHR